MKASFVGLGLAVALAHSPFGKEAIRPVDAAQILQLVSAERGKVVLLNFWATWCPPCVVEFPEIVALEKSYRKKGLAVVSVSADSADAVDSDLIPFLEKYLPGFPIYRLETEDPEAFVRAIDPDWKGSIPASFFFDRQGKTAARHFSMVSRREMEEVLERLLKKQEIR